MTQINEIYAGGGGELMEEPIGEKVFVLDTTFRDGLQTPGASLAPAEMMEVARQLVKLKVDIIETGNPIASLQNFESVDAIAQEIKGPTISALARCVPGDIESAGEAVKRAEKPMIHVYIGVSDIHIEGQLRKTREEVMDMAVKSVLLAKSMCREVEFSLMDATRANQEYIYDIIVAVIDSGATVINIPDTVGYAIPEQFAQLISDILKNVANIDKARLSVHCHNDLELATANSLAAVKAGVRQVEGTINGMGERAGNMSLIPFIAAIKTRWDYYGVHTTVRTEESLKTSQMVSNFTGFDVSPNTSIVGKNAFRHSSGVHQDGVLKAKDTFEIMNPADWGLEDIEAIVLTADSGRKALRHRLSQLGIELSDNQLDKVYDRFIRLADKKPEIYDEDLFAIVEDELPSVPQVYSVDYVQFSSGTRFVATATIGLMKGEALLQEAACGDGPVAAAYKAIDKITDIKISLDSYTIHSVTKGRDAMGNVIIKIRRDNGMITGRGTSTDIFEASVKAYVDAINKMLHSV